MPVRQRESSVIVAGERVEMRRRLRLQPNGRRRRRVVLLPKGIRIRDLQSVGIAVYLTQGEFEAGSQAKF